MDILIIYGIRLKHYFDDNRYNRLKKKENQGGLSTSNLISIKFKNLILILLIILNF